MLIPVFLEKAEKLLLWIAASMDNCHRFPIKTHQKYHFSYNIYKSEYVNIKKNYQIVM